MKSRMNWAPSEIALPVEVSAGKKSDSKVGGSSAICEIGKKALASSSITVMATPVGSTVAGTLTLRPMPSGSSGAPSARCASSIASRSMTKSPAVSKPGSPSSSASADTAIAGSPSNRAATAPLTVPEMFGLGPMFSPELVPDRTTSISSSGKSRPRSAISSPVRTEVTVVASTRKLPGANSSTVNELVKASSPPSVLPWALCSSLGATIWTLWPASTSVSNSEVMPGASKLSSLVSRILSAIVFLHCRIEELGASCVIDGPEYLALTMLFLK